MTRAEFVILLRSIQEQEIEVNSQGSREYADDSNALANFQRIGHMLQLTPEQVLLTYALKHLDGILSYLRGHTSQREDVRGRIKDLRLYLALLWAMVEEREQTA